MVFFVAFFFDEFQMTSPMGSTSGLKGAQIQSLTMRKWVKGSLWFNFDVVLVVACIISVILRFAGMGVTYIYAKSCYAILCKSACVSVLSRVGTPLSKKCIISSSDPLLFAFIQILRGQSKGWPKGDDDFSDDCRVSGLPPHPLGLCCTQWDCDGGPSVPQPRFFQCRSIERCLLLFILPSLWRALLRAI